jgi:hypothetical protein
MGWGAGTLTDLAAPRLPQIGNLHGSQPLHDRANQSGARYWNTRTYRTTPGRMAASGDASPDAFPLAFRGNDIRGNDLDNGTGRSVVFGPSGVNVYSNGLFDLVVWGSFLVRPRPSKRSRGHYELAKKTDCRERFRRSSPVDQAIFRLLPARPRTARTGSMGFR